MRDGNQALSGIGCVEGQYELAVLVYSETVTFPREEIYGLTSQIRRAVVSVPSNIAEGHARATTKEYLHHLAIAMGSLAELETQVILAERLKYLPRAQSLIVLTKVDEIGRMLRGLQKSLQAKL